MEAQYSGTRSLFRNRNFVLLFLGRMVSRVGDSLYSLGITWFILDLTGAGTVMSLYLATGMMTYLLMGPLAGVLVDRWNRVRILYITDLIRGILIGMAGILYVLGAADSIFLLLLFLITIGTNLCSALFNPAATAITPMVVSSEHLTKANSMKSVVDSGSSIFGLVLGGIVYTWVGIQGIFMINAISFLLSSFSEMFISISPVAGKGIVAEKILGVGVVIKELIDGYKYIRRENWLFIITMFSFFINIFINPIMTIYFPFIVNQIMRIEPIYLSYIQAAIGSGILLGSLAMSVRPQRDKIWADLRGAFTIMMFPLVSIVAAFFLFSTQQMEPMSVIGVFVGAAFVMGVMIAFVNIPVNVLIQRRVPNELLGRVDAVFSTLLMAGIPVGTIIGGIVTDRFPMVWILALTSGALVSIAVAGWIKKDALDF